MKVRVHRYNQTLILQTQHGEIYLTADEAGELEDRIHQERDAMQMERLDKEPPVSAQDLAARDFPKPA